MKSAADKLSFKPGATVLVHPLPSALQPLLADLQLRAMVVTDPAADLPLDAALVFVTRQEEINQLAPLLAARAPADAALWFAYPKGTSKNYRCDFNRDTGWAALGALGFEPVRMLALDADWSALRFRRAEYIKQLRRADAMMLSEAGKTRKASK